MIASHVFVVKIDQNKTNLGNIVTGLLSLARLVKKEQNHLAFLVAQYESIHTNLPPTLSVTQVKNVRKIFKIQELIHSIIFKTCPKNKIINSRILSNDISRY